jgi:hypothetical protein
LWAGLLDAWLGTAGGVGAAVVAGVAGAAAGAWLGNGCTVVDPPPQAVTRAITPAARRNSNRVAVI